MGDGGGRWRRRVDRYWPLVAVCGFGLTTWVGFLYVGVRSGRRGWQVAAGLYAVGAGVLAFLAVTRSDLPVLAEWLLLLALWAGGSVHAAVAHRRWLAWLVGGSSPTTSPASELEEPWATFVRHAEALERQVRATAGPGVDGDLLTDVERSVDLVRRLAGHGRLLVTAWQGIDLEAVDAGLAAARSQAEEVHPLVEALEAQRAAADRINQVIAEVIERLRLVDARLAEVVARAEALAGERIDPEVDVVVVDLTALRRTLDEVDASGLATPG